MSTPFVFSQHAKQTIDRMWEYYFAQDGIRLADRIISELNLAVNRLAENPKLGHRRFDLTDQPFFFYRFYRYLIIYDPASKPLFIARIYHSAQDVQRRIETEHE